MAGLMQVTCLLVLIAIAHSWTIPSVDTEDRKLLDAVDPVCTKTVGTPSDEKLTTTICTKELVANGKKQTLKTTEVTDENGVVVSRGESYSINTIN
ncbi:unnamed protein product [Adineta ricciae]|uniref:Uncharacterized protein n=1 Tax=Adineta ricciae TaxID=249248 RepID=A0A815RV16_ADIRI|nr:unnamed protein product [Adineta ricciae]